MIKIAEMKELEKIAEACGGKIKDDETGVIKGYGNIGYLTINPSEAIIDGEEVFAAKIGGRLSRRNGFHQAELRATLRAAGIEVGFC